MLSSRARQPQCRWLLDGRRARHADGAAAQPEIELTGRGARDAPRLVAGDGGEALILYIFEAKS